MRKTLKDLVLLLQLIVILFLCYTVWQLQIDIVDSAGTLCNAAEALKQHGALEIYSYIAHGVLSGNAIERIQKSSIVELVLTDSIEASNSLKKLEKIRHISIAPLMGEAIKRINSDSSVSALFD